MAEPVEHGTSVLPGAIGSVWRSEGRQEGGAGRPSPHDLSQISEHCDYTEPNGNFAGLRLITSGKGASCGQHQR